MRIVHVSDCYAPHVGGIESQVADLAAGQAAAGHDVHVLTATKAADGVLSVVRLEDGIRVHRFAARMPWGMPVNPRESELLRHRLALLRPDVVHVQAGMISPFAFDGVRQACAGHMPTVVTWHCMLRGARTALTVGARATGWRDAPFLATAVSSVAARDVSALLGRPDIPLIPNGIDPAPWRPLDTVEGAGPAGAESRGLGEERIEAAELAVVATMRLAPRKRVMPFVRMMMSAHRRLAAANIALTVDVIGAGPMESPLRAVAHRLPWLTVVGRLPRTELASRYRRAQVFVAPATQESFGIAALEARAAGLAVLGRSGTGLQDFVRDGVEGHLGSTDGDMVDQLVKWGTEHHELAAIMSHNRTVPPEHTRAAVLLAAEDAYCRVRGSAQSRASG